MSAAGAHAPSGTRIVDSRFVEVACGPDQAFAPIRRIGGDTGWYFGNGLSRVRGWLDLLGGGPGLRRGAGTRKRCAWGMRSTSGAWRRSSRRAFYDWPPGCGCRGAPGSSSTWNRPPRVRGSARPRSSIRSGWRGSSTTGMRSIRSTGSSSPGCYAESRRRPFGLASRLAPPCPSHSRTKRRVIHETCHPAGGIPVPGRRHGAGHARFQRQGARAAPDGQPCRPGALRRDLV